MQTDHAELALRGVSKSYGQSTALFPTDLDVNRGQFVTILGPSGCGKSTLLRIITGITEPSGGAVMLSGRDITGLPPEKRDIAIVFQSYALFPHMSVADNIRFGMRMKRVPASEQKRRFDHAVAICNLGDLINRNPRQLSGGQQQRVALARAIVMQPTVLLLDEPLSNLDAKLRETLRDELLALHRQTGSTSLYVTHDQTEAMSMSDRVVVMNHGRIVESGTPRELYLAPRTRFTAQFLGHTNIVPVTAEGEVARLPWGGAVPLAAPAQGAGDISLRPEAIALLPHENGYGRVADVTFMGADVHYRIDTPAGPLRARRSSGEPVLAPGTAVDLDCSAPGHILEATS